MKLLRMAFWLGVVIVLLPSPAFRPAAPPPQPGGTQAVAARTVSADARQGPWQLEACCESLRVFAKLGLDLFQRLTETGAQRGGKPARDTASSDTLTAADLRAPWHGSPISKLPALPRSLAGIR